MSDDPTRRGFLQSSGALAARQGSGPRFAIAADVVRNGRCLGQITEAVVEMKDTVRSG